MGVWKVFLEKVAELGRKRLSANEGGVINDDEGFQTEDLACVALSLNSSSTQIGLYLLNTFPYLPPAYLSRLSKSGSITNILEIPLTTQLDVTSPNPQLP